MKLQARNNQAGVTLLLAVLVLAAITAIAFSLAAIITVEIRSSGDVLRTEPALYAVQGVTEEAFFKYKRSVNDSLLDIATGDTSSDSTGCSPASACTTPDVPGNGTTFNGVSLSQPKPLARQFDPSPRVDVIAANTTNHYLFVDPNARNDFTTTQVYSDISVTQLNNIGQQVYAVFTKCCIAGVSPAARSPDALIQNQKDTLPISSLDSYQYQLDIQNPSTTSPLIVQIDATKTTPSQAKLLPLLNETLDVSASYLGLTRKYTIVVPQP